ncbi:polysaccharide pyruvyl transferase family protein, partial [Parabacteroides sp. OttesenSCG-928-G21]|nr:polysaccharide pyruvyl transferase family protein [Parabacteroides sp. OttesenSCG-928-G21]
MSPYKNGLLVMSTKSGINIGDYIQAVAAKQFFDSIDLFLERERLNQYEEDPVRLIMNGWFMHEPQNWPPSPAIQPIFVSFHINSIAYDRLLAKQSIDYLKQHEPIGCRDINTMELLQAKGVDAYFSACLTLTLDYKYKSEKKSKKCYFVDPYMPASRVNISWLVKNCWI